MYLEYQNKCPETYPTQPGIQILLGVIVVSYVRGTEEKKENTKALVASFLVPT
jgi:hypothetical protein